MEELCKGVRGQRPTIWRRPPTMIGPLPRPPNPTRLRARHGFAAYMAVTATGYHLTS